MTIALHLGDCREVLATLPDNSVDAIVSDPPYLINFMGSIWDRGDIAFDREVWTQVLRVLKPGGHLMAYGATRTYHWLACAVELAGFEIRDMVPWLQGQGMPHGLDVSKAIDALKGAEREVVGPGINAEAKARNAAKARAAGAATVVFGSPDAPVITAPATPEAQQWDGWNTQLAPGHEPCVLARKPLSERTVALNVLRWGTGALNIDACRLTGPGAEAGRTRCHGRSKGRTSWSTGDPEHHEPMPAGRWPPNVTLSEAAATRLDAMVGKRKSGALLASTPRGGNGRTHGAKESRPGRAVQSSEAQGPSEFFYVAKAATRERENGCEHLRWAAENGKFAGRPWREGDDLLVDGKGRPIGCPHPTTKPLALMRHLVRLVTPPGGTVLDPFMGSGTTGVAAVCEGFGFIGIDMTPWAFTIAEARIRWAQGRGPSVEDLPATGSAQASLF